MKRMTFNETTVTASGGCVICSQKDAARYFSEHGAKGETKLCYVYTVNDRRYVLWVNMEDKRYVFLPLFAEDVDLKPLHTAIIFPLSETTMIYHKRDQDSGICYIFLKDKNIVRQIKIFSDEYMIENYCAVQGFSPNGVILCKVFSIKDNRYITTCWSIYYENPNEIAGDGEPQNYEILLPVDFADSDILAEAGVSNIYTSPLKEGETFKVQGQLYRVLKDDEDKLFITKDLFTHYGVKSREKQPADKADKRKSACRIVSLQNNN